MQSTTSQTKLLDAMVLLEVADKMYPSVDHFFSKYTAADFIRSAHDLIQCVHSNGESQLDAETLEVLATLEGARKYMDVGGHLLKPSASPEVQTEQPRQTSGLFRRVLARIGLK